MADTVKLSVEFPESLVADLWIDEATASAKMKEAVVLDLFRQKRISIRKGAELLDLSYREFLALLSRRQVPMSCYDIIFLPYSFPTRSTMRSFKLATSSTAHWKHKKVLRTAGLRSYISPMINTLPTC